MKQNNNLNDINTLRLSIDRLDSALLYILAERYDIVRKISNIKKDINMPILDKKREDMILKMKKSLGVELGLPNKLVTNIFNIIMSEGRKLE